MWYILKRGKPVMAKSTKAYIYWSQNSRYKAVAQENINDIYVSTTFLGLDHGYGSQYPVLWETMIFGGEHDQYQERYISLEAAQRGHKRAVEMLHLLT
jgi:hypothetical protein